MDNISNFFSKIQNTQIQKLIIYKIVQEAVKSKANIEVNLDSISFKSKSVIIKGISQTAKSQIFTKIPSLLEEINAKIYPRIITKISFSA